jgi:hypothetical protein
MRQSVRRPASRPAESEPLAASMRCAGSFTRGLLTKLPSLFPGVGLCYSPASLFAPGQT